MKLEGTHFELEQGEMFKIIDINGGNKQWVTYPATGELSVVGKTVYATTDGKTYEIGGEVTKIGDFTSAIIQDPLAFLNSEEGKRQDEGQDELPITKND